VVLSSGSSFPEVLRLAASDDGKAVGMRSLLVIPLVLLSKAACNELANAEEEVRSAVNCFEFESWSFGSLVVAFCATVKKKQETIVMKGSFVNCCLEKFLGLC
jgi:hypothetical protein